MRRALVVVDLGFGDAGKGSTVDALTRWTNTGIVVRFNGGPQAGHNVVLPDGTHHTFNLFGSGTLAGAQTYLAAPVWIDPVFLKIESERLEKINVANPLSLVVAHWECGVITPFHQALGKLREIVRGKNKHGSCGMGVGEAMADAIYAGRRICMGDLFTYKTQAAITDALVEIQKAKFEQWLSLRTQYDVDNLDDLGETGYKALKTLTSRGVAAAAAKLYRMAMDGIALDTSYRTSPSILRECDTVIFEGAQGILIDQTWGLKPYCTWSDCTGDYARTIANAQGARVSTIGVMRPYMVRHGEGPLPTADYDAQSLYGGWVGHNVANEFQGATGVGFLDLALLKYAIDADGAIDGLMLNHMDHFHTPAPVCTGYLVGEGNKIVQANRIVDASVMKTGKPFYQNVKDRDDWFSLVGEVLGKPVWGMSKGPTHKDKEFLAKKELE